jgi:signal transduction histidine kinase
MHEADNNKKLPERAMLLVGVSYLVFLAIFVFIFSFSRQSLKELEELQHASVEGSQKMLLISRFAELARNRARNTLQILETDDVFMQDELNQTIEKYAAQFAEVREELDKMPFSEEDLALYHSALELVPTILPAQRKAVELLMYGQDKQGARKLIYDIVLPGQQQIIDTFSELLSREQASIRKTVSLIDASISSKHQKTNYLYTVVLLMLSLLSFFVIRTIYRDRQLIQKAYDELEDRVQERTFELKEARDDAVSASQAKSEFLSSMSHELRTPLNAVIGFSQMLEMSSEMDPDDLDSVHEINKAGNHLLGLINEILDLAKIESGRMDLIIMPLLIDDVIAAAQSLVMPLLDKHGISLKVPQGNPYIVQADLTRLKQVLINLLSNAIKYNRPNGTVELTVHESERPGFARINVIDSGTGIEPDKLELLFEPFNRLGHEGSRIEGTGIGLTITRRIVEMMNGYVGVESRVGEGSTFWVDIPFDLD